jgi:hypothetical protein
MVCLRNICVNTLHKGDNSSSCSSSSSSSSNVTTGTTAAVAAACATAGSIFTAIWYELADRHVMFRATW